MLLSKSVLDNVKSLVLLTNKAGEVEYANPYSLSVLGYEIDDLSNDLFQRRKEWRHCQFYQSMPTKICWGPVFQSPWKPG